MSDEATSYVSDPIETSPPTPVDEGVQGFTDKRNYRPVKHNMQRKTQLHLERVSRYFDDKPDNWQTVADFINGDERMMNEGLSLRLLYYFCSKYSQRKAGVYYRHNGEIVDLFDRFQTAMSTRRLKAMDVFQRRSRMNIEKHGLTIRTTAAQLNFFTWAFNNGAIKYVRDNRRELVKCMKVHQKKQEAKKRKRRANKTPPEKKRKKIIPRVHVIDGPETVHF
jgi:hypothetical protein